MNTSQTWTGITSILSNDREQVGHFLMRLLILSSMHWLQNRCPQVFKAVFLKLFRQIVQRAKV